MSSNDANELLAIKNRASEGGISISKVQFFGAIGLSVLSATVLAATTWANLKSDFASLKSEQGRSKEEIDRKLSEFDRLKDYRSTQIEALKNYDTANTLVTTGLQGQFNTNSERVKKVEDFQSQLMPRINEMWFMKEHGISNKEDFQQRKGYPAPSDSKAGDVTH